MERPPSDAAFLKEARLAFEYSLANFIWKQAVFFAERLVAECPCEEMNYLLALAYFHNQETGRAHWHLQGNRLPEARYLLARCCFLLQRWDEAEEALIAPTHHGCAGSLHEVVNGAAGLYLLGQVKEKQSRREQAVECYAKCLELCPFMWDAFERWSWLILGSPSPSRSSTASMAPSAFSDEKFAHAFAAQPGGNSGALPQVGVAAPPSALRPQPEGRGHGSVSIPGRRSDREAQHHVTTRKERRGDLQRSGGGSVLVHASGHSSASNVRDSKPPGNSQSEREAASEVSLASLLCKMGMALHAHHGYDGQQTLQLLGALPKRHYDTGYVLCLAGLCHFESADYRKAEQSFQQAWRIEPRRIESLEYYSSALWHLRKDIELGHLAQQCVQWDRFKPQVWCVVGNCFSLQREHDTAIKFFRRAMQVDPSFTYAYTLCGHEFVANEKFDKAMPMYEHAISVDPRHYNAWWGLGNIFHRQEEHESARYHFLKALEINKTNSVLRCYLGMVLDSLNNPLMALDNFDRAAQGESQNGMAYYQKACVLMTLERYEEALADLKKVRCLAPKEACVHFQLGKVYMKLQRDKKALLHFNIAMDLNRDSKDYHTIKTHIERLDVAADRGALAGRQSQPGLAELAASHGGVPSSPGGRAGLHDGGDPRVSRGGGEQQVLAGHGGLAATPGARTEAALGPQTPSGATRGSPHTTARHAAYAAQHHSGAHTSTSPGRSLPDPGSGGAGLAGPQTPAVARGSASYGAPMGARNVWSGTRRGPGVSFHPPGRGTPATGAAHSQGFRI